MKLIPTETNEIRTVTEHPDPSKRAVSNSEGSALLAAELNRREKHRANGTLDIISKL